MTLREALGGPWATHWGLWVALFLPTTLLVVLRESVAGFDSWWWPLVSSLLQHLAVGLIVLGGGALARRRFAALPLRVVSMLWAAAGISRGLIGGALAETVAGADGEYLERSLVWLLGTVVWVPLVIYTAAELDRRRLLLGALDSTTALIAEQRTRAGETGDEVRRSLETAVRETLEPALGELVASLESSRVRLSASALAELSLRVSQLHDHTADLLEATPTTPEQSVTTRSSVRRAFDVPPRLPWLIAALTMLSASAVMLPDVWRVFGGAAALELWVSIVAASVVIGVIPWLVSVIAPESAAARNQRMTVIACASGIALAVVVMLTSGIDSVTQNGLTVVPLLAICLAIACAAHVGALVLAYANREAAEQLDLQSSQIERERQAHRELVNRERRRLTELMHGPVQGRLAACVMALNFTATTELPDEQSSELADSVLVNAVLDHLRAVSRDLSSIAAADTPTAP